MLYFDKFATWYCIGKYAEKKEHQRVSFFRLTIHLFYLYSDAERLQYVNTNASVHDLTSLRIEPYEQTLLRTWHLNQDRSSEVFRGEACKRTTTITLKNLELF